MKEQKLRFFNLDVAVSGALEFFSRTSLPAIECPFKRPLVVGSGNAFVTGKILFSEYDAVFADESTYLWKLDNISEIDGCILISASGGKHAPIIANEVRKREKEIILITTNPDAQASKIANKTIIFPKVIEPYTYNTSTYMGMILSKTKEDLENVKESINRISLEVPKNLKKYNAVFIIVPSHFESLREMFITKFDELFGPKIAIRVYTLEQAKHAKTIVHSDKELFISFGYKNEIFGKNRWNIALPASLGPAGMMALGYWVIGQIQKQNEPYFRNSIKRYCKEVSKYFGETIEPWVY